MPFLAVIAIHLAGFAGCLIASAAKNVILARHLVLTGKPLSRMVTLDRLSGLSATVILISGISLAWRVKVQAAGPPADLLFWGKVALFTMASIAVLRSKPALRRALATGSLNVTPSLRIVFAFDLAAILLVAALGRLLAAAL